MTSCLQSDTSASSFRRIGGLCLRHLLLLINSPMRIFDLVYWSLLMMSIWGFVTVWIAGQASSLVTVAAVLLGCVLLWDVCVRSTLGISVSFLEEMWARNLGHLFVSPLRPWEFVVALTIAGTVRMALGFIPSLLVASLAFGFDPGMFGIAGLGFLLCLALAGWGVGLMGNAIALRLGMSSAPIVWMLAFSLGPLSAVFYPVSVLPPVLRGIALCLPTTHVFEGMRALVRDGVLDLDHLGMAVSLDAVLLVLGGVCFAWALRWARQTGRLLALGE